MRLFNLTENHLDLLKNMVVTWQDAERGIGAPAVDPEHPYGSEDSFHAIARNLHLDDHDPATSEAPQLSGEQKAAFEELHRETQTALQIVLKTGDFEVGLYEADDFSDNWRKKEDPYDC